MKNLLTAWKGIEPRFREATVVLFLDYDGTLTPIAARPRMAKLPARRREIMLDLSLRPDVKIAVISGRTLEDVKKSVGIRNILYAGNHGLEIETPMLRHVHPAAIEFRRLAKKLASRLRAAYAFMPGIFIEDKTFSVSVHYRQVPEEKVAQANMLLLKEIGSYLSQSRLVLTEGKKVWEIRPPAQWDKGHTVLWLFGRLLANTGKRALPVYLGDDVTDEDAFRALRHRGITVKVTEDPRENSAAEYFLRSPDEVSEFLGRLIKVKTIEHKESPLR